MALPFVAYFSSQFALITIATSIFIHSTSSSSSAASTSPMHSHHFRKIYAFGDSYTDTGNTKAAENPPYGTTFFHRPANRLSDGRLVIDFVTQALSLPFLPPYLNQNADKSTGVNFAVAGSTAINHSFFVKNNLTLNRTPQSLQTQLDWFNKSLEALGCRGAGTRNQCDEAIKDALFWVGEIGANDYSYSLGSSVSSSTIQQLAIESVIGFLQALLTKGAKYIVVQGLQPGGCLTMALALFPNNDRDDIGCVATANHQSYSHNTELQSKLHHLRAQFPHSVIVYADYWNSYRAVLKNAGKYGFREPFKACCGSGGGPYNFQFSDWCGSPSSSSCSDPSQYINWDGVHLPEAMNKAVSDSFLEGPFCQPPLEKCFKNRTGPACSTGKTGNRSFNRSGPTPKPAFLKNHSRK